jgi:hypothetical protein
MIWTISKEKASGIVSASIQHGFGTSNLGRLFRIDRQITHRETVHLSFCGRGFYGRIRGRGAGSAFPQTETTADYSNGREHKQSRMNLYKTIAVAGLVLSVISSAALAAEPSTPAASVALPAMTATPVAPPASPSKIKATKKRFLLTHSSSVYEKPDKVSPVIGHVRYGTHESVTGVTGDWLQIRLSNGKVGFIPSSAAE